MEVWIEIAFNTWETRSRSNRKFDITPFEQQQTLRWRLPCDQLHLALVCSLHLLDKQCLYSSLQPCFLRTPSLTHKLESLNPSTLHHLTCRFTVSASEAVSLETKASSTSAPGDRPTFWPLSQLGLSRCVDGFGWSPAGGQDRQLLVGDGNRSAHAHATPLLLNTAGIGKLVPP